MTHINWGGNVENELLTDEKNSVFIESYLMGPEYWKIQWKHINTATSSKWLLDSKTMSPWPMIGIKSHKRNWGIAMTHVGGNFEVL